jgi:hypothetical protein
MTADNGTKTTTKPCVQTESAQIDTTEDHKHLAKCPSQPGREEAKEKLWDDIYNPNPSESAGQSPVGRAIEAIRV